VPVLWNLSGELIHVVRRQFANFKPSFVLLATWSLRKTWISCAGIDGGGESRVERDCRGTTLELARSEVFKPVSRRLHGGTT